MPSSSSDPPAQGASGLRVEHLDEALGILITEPRFSWRLPDGVARQVGYRIRTSVEESPDLGWDTGRVESDVTLLVPYEGPALGSRHHVTWQVKIWTAGAEHGERERDWSKPSWFELGLLDPVE